MGIFHKTLMDAEAAIRAGDMKKAHEILSAHIRNEHQTEMSISETIRELHTYQQNLIGANRFAAGAARDSALRAVEEAKRALSAAEIQLWNLFKIGKLE